MSRPRSRPGRRLVRTSERSRSDQEHLHHAYELALPWARRVIAASPPGLAATTLAPHPASAHVLPKANVRSSNPCFLSVPQQRFGG
jgi:hypothetical protein